MSAITPGPSHYLVGILCAVLVVFVWAGWIIVSRIGMQSSLGIHDLLLLRYGLSCLVVSPFILAWWPRHLPVWKILVISLCCAGVPYAYPAFLGMGKAPVAYAAVMMNGTIPIFVAIISFLWARKRPGIWQILAVPLLLGGAVMISCPALVAVEGWIDAAALFLIASGILSTYMVGVKVW
ncbi:MAG: EamA family transporter, partial [Pseudomonadota bacterium]